jgi:hypothetical protein
MHTVALMMMMMLLLPCMRMILTCCVPLPVCVQAVTEDVYAEYLLQQPVSSLPSFYSREVNVHINY